MLYSPCTAPRETLLAVFEGERDWAEYDEYRETPEKKRKHGARWTILEIARDGEVLWQNDMPPGDMAEFTPQEREEWSAASFRMEVAEAGLDRIEDLLIDCTVRSVRKELKKRRREVRRYIMRDVRYYERMHARSARAEVRARKEAYNQEAASWLEKVSR